MRPARRARPEGARGGPGAAAASPGRAGGGEQEVLGDVLLGALDGAAGRLGTLLADARRDANAAAEVLALDALARLGEDQAPSAEADVRMASASHFITERDRVDRHARSAR